MKIPKEITIGRKTYMVQMSDNLINGKQMGQIDYNNYVMKIVTHATYKRSNGTEVHIKFSDEEVHDTFWHELTHGILHEMNHPLRDNESFVTKFANHLSHAINTAQL
jgi:hypothetical protein